MVKWLGSRFTSPSLESLSINIEELAMCGISESIEDNSYMVTLGKDIVVINAELQINATPIPEYSTFGTMKDIVSADAPEDIYISPVGCFGIIRRKRERNLKINSRLEEVLLDISSQMTAEEIEKRSRVQRRGRFSDSIDSSISEEQNNKIVNDSNKLKDKEIVQLSLFDFFSQD